MVSCAWQLGHIIIIIRVFPVFNAFVYNYLMFISVNIISVNIAFQVSINIHLNISQALDLDFSKFQVLFLLCSFRFRLLICRWDVGLKFVQGLEQNWLSVKLSCLYNTDKYFKPICWSQTNLILFVPWLLAIFSQVNYLGHRISCPI